MKLFGIDHEAYLHNQRVVVIEAQMQNCEDCTIGVEKWILKNLGPKTDLRLGATC